MTVVSFQDENANEAPEPGGGEPEPEHKMAPDVSAGMVVVVQYYCTEMFY
jgi:hypothetical protein